MFLMQQIFYSKVKMHYLKTILLICVALLNLPLSYASNESDFNLSPSRNEFQYFDNNVTLNYNYSATQNTSEFSTVGLGASALFDNNIWLSGNAATLLTYDLSNNNRGLSNLYQNKSGSLLSIKAGYAFTNDRLNVIPYMGVAYSNLLIAYNYDSAQQFIFENPAYSIMGGANVEYIIIPRTLKVGLDTNLNYSSHKAVIPNSSSTLGHINYSDYLLSLSPSLQYNINSRLTVIGFYALNSKFSGSSTPQNVYYSQINVNSSSIINNDDLTSSFGIKFGILF
jgi:hypothetical protein